jgi:hypothetical protein
VHFAIATVWHSRVSGTEMAPFVSYYSFLLKRKPRKQCHTVSLKASREAIQLLFQIQKSSPRLVSVYNREDPSGASLQGEGPLSIWSEHSAFRRLEIHSTKDQS